MKKITILILIILFTIPNFAFAKTKKDSACAINIGASCNCIKKILGKPNVKTVDSDGFEAWIFDGVEKPLLFENQPFGIDDNNDNLTLIIKFDKNNVVKSYTYQKCCKLGE